MGHGSTPIEESKLSTKLSAEDYTKNVAELVEIVEKSNPRVALEELRKRADSNPSILRACHTLIHEIGHTAYKKYGDFGEAMKYHDSYCNSGYVHGVIEGHFTKDKDIYQEMNTLCKDYPAGKFARAQCYHGMGHGLMYFTDNDLPKSLELCNSYTDSSAQSNCTWGVFMENFSANPSLHPSQYINPEDPLYPCPEQTFSTKRDCYLWAPTYYLGLHLNDYAGALAWCKTAELFYQETCATGVGGQTMRENTGNPKLVENLCMQGDPDQVAPCVDGMIRIYISHFGSLAPARKLCDQLLPSNKQTCLDAVAGLVSFF